MDNKRFKDFLKAAQQNEKVSYSFEESKPYSDIINEIYRDVSRFQYYTLDGRLQNVLIKILKDPKYETECYFRFLKDLEIELKKLIVSNVMLLPLNFIKSSQFKKDLVLNDYMNLFIYTQEDFRKHKENVRQEYRKDKKHELDDNLCRYFKEKLNSELDKGHILLAKDRNFLITQSSPSTLKILISK